MADTMLQKYLCEIIILTVHRKNERLGVSIYCLQITTKTVQHTHYTVDFLGRMIARGFRISVDINLQLNIVKTKTGYWIVVHHYLVRQNKSLELLCRSVEVSYTLTK